MINWLQFFNIIFWVTILLFISNFNNFIKLLFFSELVWVMLYCYTLYISVVNDDLLLYSSSIFILGFAGLEYSIGIIIILAFKQIIKSLDLNELDLQNKSFFFNKKDLYINRYIYKIN